MIDYATVKIHHPTKLGVDMKKHIQDELDWHVKDMEREGARIKEIEALGPGEAPYISFRIMYETQDPEC